MSPQRIPLDAVLEAAKPLGRCGVWELNECTGAGVVLFSRITSEAPAQSLLTNLPWTTATKEDIQEHFKDAAGKIQDIKLMNGFGFIEYEDPIDARDVVPGELAPMPSRD